MPIDLLDEALGDEQERRARRMSVKERVLSLLEEAEAELETNADAVAGQITIAAFATAARGGGGISARRVETQHDT